MTKLLKRKCVVIIWKVENDVRVVGVFKNEKLAQNYIKWVGDKHVGRYSIKHSARYIYVDDYETKELIKELDGSCKE